MFSFICINKQRRKSGELQVNSSDFSICSFQVAWIHFQTSWKQDLDLQEHSWNVLKSCLGDTWWADAEIMPPVMLMGETWVFAVEETD